MADQFIQRPGVEGLVLRLVGQDIVCREPLQPIGQPGERRGAGVERGARPAFDDQDVQPLALERQLLLDIHPPGTAGEEVGQGDAEESVPGGEGVHGASVAAGPACPLSTGGKDRQVKLPIDAASGLRGLPHAGGTLDLRRGMNAEEGPGSGLAFFLGQKARPDPGP